MPVKREQKITPELLARYKEMGGCVRPGMELWFFSGKKLSVGEVVKVEQERGVIHIKKADGIELVLTPMDTILMAEVPKRIRTVLKKQQAAG